MVTEKRTRTARFATWLVVGCIFVLLACASHEKKPAGILPPEKMIPILEDLYVAEEKADRARVYSDSVDQAYPLVEQRIFESHQTTDSIFQVSFQYYIKHHDELESIYGRLLDSLNLHLERARMKNVTH